jgi:hypothetical protein
MRRFDPDDRPLRREPLTGEAQGDLQHRARGKGGWEAEQEPRSTDIACPALKGRASPTLALTGDGDL